MKRTLSLLLLTVAASACPADPILSATAYGKVRFGDTLEHVEQLLNEKTPAVIDPDDRLCREITFSLYPNVTFMVEEGIVTRAESTSSIPTSAGVTVGSSLEEIKKKFPSVVIEPHHYDPAGHYLIFKALDGKFSVLMEESEGKVTAVRGGREPSVEYVEGCL